MNVRIGDNGSAYVVSVNGLITSAHYSLGNAWRRIEWMHKVANQNFTVGPNEIHVTKWLEAMYKNGCLE